jgi:hypothetical protein
MAHIVEPALSVADLAELASKAYAAGDKATAQSARAEYVAILAANPSLNGVA